MAGHRHGIEASTDLALSRLWQATELQTFRLHVHLSPMSVLVLGPMRKSKYACIGTKRMSPKVKLGMETQVRLR